MPKYEIMLILDPKAEENKTKEMVEKVFGKQIEKFEKMDQTQLAYKINNSTTAKYFLINVDSVSENINEFTRKANLSKDIWRFLTINLDEEKANKEAKPRVNFGRRKQFTNSRNRQEHFANKKQESTKSFVKKETEPKKQDIVKREG